MAEEPDRRAALAADDPPAEAELDLFAEEDEDEDPPRLKVSRKQMLLVGVFVLGMVAFLYLVLPQLADVGDTLDRIGDGDRTWLAAAFALEVLAYASYGVLFKTVVAEGEERIDWKANFQITLSGVAATRLFAAAGAGGIALTAWALRRAGMARRLVARRMIAFLVLMYLVYMSALVLGGIGLRTGLLPGNAPFGVTVLPAIFGAVVIALVLLITFLLGDVERQMQRLARGHGRAARLAARLATAPQAIADGTREAFAALRRRDPGLLGAVLFWAFDIAVLWACFHAFGAAPEVPVLVMAYFVGFLANTLPLPGGVGGVEGGMIGTFAAFGVEPGLAVVAVLVYRGFAFWLPTLPGVLAYVALRKTVARWRRERGSTSSTFAAVRRRPAS